MSERVKRKGDASRRVVHVEPLTPNAETEEAMKAARRGEVVKVGGVDSLLADLHKEDRVPEE